MQLSGHVGVALTAYAPVGFVTASLGRPWLSLAGAFVTVALASLPDCDLHLPGFAHRGYTHTVWFAVAVGVVCGAAFATVGDAGAVLLGLDVDALSGVGRGVFLGGRVTFPGASGGVLPGVGVFGFVVGTVAILSHVAVDSLTPMGVAPLAPISRRRYSFGLTRSADPVANRRLLLLGLGTTGVTVALVVHGFA